MKFFKRKQAFQDDEAGAVTVDWVVLTAAIVGLGVTVMATVRGGTMELADTIAHALSAHVHTT